MTDPRHARIVPILEYTISRRLAGEQLSDETIISSHPDLMPELREMLAELRDVEIARGRARRADSPSSTLQVPPDFLPGYEFRGEIHRGGQGVVYRALQKSTKRQVAVKLLREAAVSGEGERARFQREVEILASLHHPNIVTIHESGEVEGRQYFVMDYIAGAALDDFADERRQKGLWTTEDALGAIQTVCEAVNGAHLRGVIHRDIKPSNIRVDEAGQPRVLDFGLAKRSGDDAPIDVTVAGQFIGSLPWCSPEQAEGRPDKVDMRSDVYSLGVVLYRILTGRLPHEASGTTREILDRILRDPPLPPSRHNPMIDGEVDTIVLKCLVKDPERRYQTAGHLAADIGRYLRGEAIEAKRDSGWYVLRKTLRRYRLQTAVAAGLILVVTGSAIALGILYGQANVAARKAEITSNFLREILSAADPSTAQGREVTVRDMLDAASGRIDEELAEEPQVAAAMHETIGQTYLSLGRPAEAETSYRAAVEISSRTLGPDHHDTLSAENGLATALEDQTRYDEAESLYRKCVEASRRTLSDEDLLAIDVLHNLANLLRKRGKTAEAQAMLQEALERSRRILGDEHSATLTTRKILAGTWQDMGDYDKAEPEYRDILAIQRRTLGDRAPLTLGTLSYLAILLKARGKLDEAAPLYDELVRLAGEVWGPDHPDTLRSTNSYGRLLHAQGKLAEAEKVLRDVLAAMTRVLGENHFDTIVTTNNLSLLLAEQGRLAEAEPLARLVVEKGRAILGEENTSTLIWMNNLADLLARKGEAADAENLYRQVLDARTRLLGDEHPHSLTTKCSLANVLTEEGGPRLPEAEAMLRQVLQLRQIKIGSAHADTLLAMNNLIKALLARGGAEEAEPLAREALDTSRRTLGIDHPLSLLIANNAGAVFAQRGRRDEGISLLTDAVGLADNKLPPTHIYRSMLRTTLGKSLIDAGRHDEARPWLTQARESLIQTLGPQHPATLRADEQLRRLPQIPPHP